MLTYELSISLTFVKKLQPLAPPEMTDSRGPVHSAGFIIYRQPSTSGAPIEFLLLQSRGNKNWGAPKGHVEAGEGTFAAAVRETAEEAGIDAAADLDVQENFNVKMK